MTTRICALDDLTVDTATQIISGDRKLAVVRLGDDVYVIGDTCTHADFSLAEGELDSESGMLECWKHGSEFDVRTGEPDTLPATRATPTYEVTITNGDVFVELDPA